MKKFLLQVLSWVLTPALFLGYYLTRDPAFMFIYGAVAVIMFFLIILMLLAIGYMHVEKSDDYEAAMLKSATQFTGLKTAQGHIYNLAAIILLAFWHFYWLSAFMILYYLVVMFFWHILKSEAVRLSAKKS